MRQEGRPVHTVRSSVSYTLNANVENLVLTGNSGDNVLVGGDSADTFVFGTGSGKDRIVDFDATEFDVIDVSHWTAVTSFETLSAHATDTAAGLQIKFGSDILTIHGLLKASLDEHLFTFAV